jgi:hypothetical protein
MSTQCPPYSSRALLARAPSARQGAPSAGTECVAADAIGSRAVGAAPLASFPSSRCQTAQFLFSRHALLRPVLLSSSHLRSVQPEARGGRSAGRRSALLVALVRRDATLARRGPSRATGTPPLGAPPWRFRPRARFRLRRCRRLRREGSTPPGDRARLRSRASRIRDYEPRSTPLPAPPSGSSPETPLDERGWTNHTASSVCSQLHYVVE